MSNLPDGVNQGMIDKALGGDFEKWLIENESELLLKFQDEWEHVITISAVKYWTGDTLKIWNLFLNTEWEAYRAEC